MKIFIWIIAVSVTANVLMAGLLIKAITRRGFSPVVAAASPSGAAQKSPATKNGRKRIASAASSGTSVQADNTTWNDLQADDLKEFIRRLRSAGCPEQTIRDIIVAEVNRRFAARSRELWPDRYEDQPYWQVQKRDPAEQAKNRRRWRTDRELQKEKSALLVELLGVDPEKEQRKEEGYDESFNWMDQRVSFLPEAKREAALKYLEDFEDKMQDFYQRNQGIWDAQYRAELRDLEAEKMKGLAQILTPDELREYDLRQSQTAQQMSWELRGLSLTRSEYESLFDIRKKYGDGIYNYGDIEGDAMAKVQENQKAMKAEIVATLGEAKGREYQRSQDYSYQELNRITKKLDLPAGTAAKVYDFKETAEKSVSQLQSDQNLTPDQRKQALQQIRAETEKAVKESLGDSGYKRYLKQGGWWINNIAPGKPVNF